MEACCDGKIGFLCWFMVFLFVLGGLGRALFMNKNPPSICEQKNIIICRKVVHKEVYLHYF